MRVLIISDTHGKHAGFDEALEQVGKVDMLVHMGDVEDGEIDIQANVDCECHFVAGNNDFFSDLPREEEFLIGNYKVWITHGHNYYVSMGTERLKEEAISRKVDIVMYGHTHRPDLDLDGEVMVLNPGSLSYPRQEGRRPSYILMDVDEFGEADFQLKFL